MTFDHDGLTFDLRDLGPTDGEVVILLHGYPESKECWAEVATSLADAGYRVLAPDQRGYSAGARPRGRRAYALDRLMGDVLALADEAGASRVHVVGHDWGGVVAWGMGRHHPHRLASLTSLTTPHPSALARSLVTSKQLLRSWYVLFYQLPRLPELFATTKLGRRLFRQALVRSGLTEEWADRCLALQGAGASGPAINWYRAIPFAPRAAPKAVGVPTLYVYAGRDFAIGRAAAEDTGRFVDAHYRYAVIEGASHWLPEESAEKITPMILDHLRGHPAR